MASKQKRYRSLEQSMTIALIADTVLFIIFLIAAVGGTGWLKVLTAVFAILLSVLAIGYLFLTGEALRRRSLWLTVGFAAVVLCIVVSLICNYPSPKDLSGSAGIVPGAVGTILLP